jgi:hypothetical protein
MSDKDTVHSYSPDKLLYHFNRTNFGLIVVLAILIHAVLILGLSVNEIRDRWIDPVGAKKRKDAAIAAAEAAMSNRLGMVTSATNLPAAVSPASPGAASNTIMPAGKPALAAEISARSNSLVVKQITEIAKPGEIPAQPDDLGISIQDTNPR